MVSDFITVPSDCLFGIVSDFYLPNEALWPGKFNTFLTAENFSILKFTPSFQKQNMPLSNAFHVQLTNSLRLSWLVSGEKKNYRNLPGSKLLQQLVQVGVSHPHGARHNTHTHTHTHERLNNKTHKT